MSFLVVKILALIGCWMFLLGALYDMAETPGVWLGWSGVGLIASAVAWYLFDD